MSEEKNFSVYRDKSKFQCTTLRVVRNSSHKALALTDLRINSSIHKTFL